MSQSPEVPFLRQIKQPSGIRNLYAEKVLFFIE